MKMKLLLIFTASLLMLSCGNSSKTSEQDLSTDQTYYLEKEDSLTVKDVIATTFVFQTGDNEHLIFRDAAASIIYVFDRENGKLVHKWEKKGDVPGAFSMTSRNLTLTDEGRIVLVDLMMGLRVFEKDGEFIFSETSIASQWSLGGAFSLFKENQVVKIKGQDHLLYSMDKLEGEQDYSPGYLTNRKNLVLTNLETGEHRLILPFPEGSKFVNGKVYPFEDFRPRFVVDEGENKLYLMFQNEAVLYTYSWNDGDPIYETSQPVELPGFEGNEGYETGTIQMAQITDQENEPMPARIQAMVKVDGGFLLSYSTKPSSKDIYQIYKEKKATQDQFYKLIDETRRKTVFMNTSGSISQVDFPEMHYESFDNIDGKIHWMKKPDPGVESEEFTVYWGSLKSR